MQASTAGTGTLLLAKRAHHSSQQGWRFSSAMAQWACKSSACYSLPQRATACHSVLQPATACYSLPQHATACHSVQGSCPERVISDVCRSCKSNKVRRQEAAKVATECGQATLHLEWQRVWTSHTAPPMAAPCAQPVARAVLQAGRVLCIAVWSAP
eukprot:364955-Chlamydomonas_euryale.AAC.4